MPISDNYNFLGRNSHKIPLKDVKSNYKTLQYLEEWLKSYKPEQIFGRDGGINRDVFSILPKADYRIGTCVDRILEKKTDDFYLPSLENYKYNKGEIRSNIEEVDRYLLDIVNKSVNFRIVSPDELHSNKFEMLGVSSDSGNKKIIEVLNECICMGWQQGYIRSGGIAIMISYESFIPIVTSMLAQYEKYIYQSNLIKWRREVGSLNFLLTSIWWTNTYSHQNPEFINSLIAKEWDFINIYFPIDGNTFLITVEKMIQSKNQINTVIVNKQPTKQLMDLNEAYEAIENGVIKWNRNMNNTKYEIVVVLIGESALTEGLLCKEWCDDYLPEYNILYLSLLELMSLRKGVNCGKCLYDFLQEADSSASIIFVFHGYKSVIKQLIDEKLSGYNISILGYQDKSIMSAPIEFKLAVNNLSRYDIELEIVRFLHDGLKIKEEKWKELYNRITMNKQEIINKYYDKSSKF